MELYATGCNAWCQLNFGRDAATIPQQDQDLSSFTMVTSGEVVEKPVSRLTHTIVRVDGRNLIAGHLFDKNMAAKAYSEVMAANGISLRLAPGQSHLALSKRDSRGQFRSEPPFFVERPVKQIAAFDTGFAILYDDGTVATMGDPRFSAMLGRSVVPDEPADQFVRVHDLDQHDDPVVHITACGYTVGALTLSGSMYLWGRHPPSRSQEPSFFPHLCPFPNYVEVDHGIDVQDFAIGETHAIALTTEGDIYVLGNNENGQLGLSIKETRTWIKHDFVAPSDRIISGVSAGPRASFILTSRKHASTRLRP